MFPDRSVPVSAQSVIFRGQNSTHPFLYQPVPRQSSDQPPETVCDCVPCGFSALKSAPEPPFSVRHPVPATRFFSGCQNVEQSSFSLTERSFIIQQIDNLPLPCRFFSQLSDEGYALFKPFDVTDPHRLTSPSRYFRRGKYITCGQKSHDLSLLIIL